MTNTVSAIASTPFTGLGTQTYTVPTTGIYTIGVKVTLPWLSSDQPQAVANPPTRNVETITTVADSSGSLNNTYWKFFTAGNLNGYYVWYNINSAGTDPAVSGLTGIEVDGATGASASTLGGATRTAIAAAVSTSLVVVSGATSGIILTNTQYGACTAAVDGAAPTGFTFAVGTAGTYGATSGLTIQVKKNSTVLMTLSQPTPTQPLLAGSVTAQCTAADSITVVLSSLATVDSVANSIKGIINVFQGS